MPIQSKQQPPYYQEYEQPNTVTLLKKTTIIPHAQILTLPSSPVELIPTPGSSKVILINSALAILNTSAGAYTNAADASLSLKNPALTIDLNIPTLTQLGLQTPGTYYYQLSIPYIAEGSGTFAGQEITEQLPLTAITNTAIVLSDYWAGISDYTAGNAANTLTVTIYYTIITL